MLESTFASICIAVFRNHGYMMVPSVIHALLQRMPDLATGAMALDGII